MQRKILPYLYVFLIGVGGAFMVFIIMNSFPKAITFIFVSILYLLLGVWVNRLQINNVLIAIILLNSTIWAVFTPMAFKISLFIPFLILSPVFSVLGLLLGKRFLLNPRESVNAGKVLQRLLSNYILPIGLGFFGMFVTMFSMLLGYMMLQGAFPVYILAYPIVYMIIAALLSSNRKHWLQDGLLVCLIPVLYWMVLMPFTGKLDWSTYEFTNQPTVMFVLMPIVILLVLVTGYLIHQKKNHPKI